MKGTKVTFRISTGILSFMMLFSAGMYIFNNAMWLKHLLL